MTGSQLYTEYASRYVEMIGNKSVYLDYERPMIRELAGDVRGAAVLDLGCGPGAHLPWLIESGASVTAVDASDAFLDIVRRDYPSVETARIDLNDGLSPLPDQRYDLAISSLVLHYVADWTRLLRDVYRVLRPSGRFVLSTHHPFSPQIVQSVSSYFDTCIVDDRFGPPGQEVDVRYYHRPLHEIVNPFVAANLRIERMEEPAFESHPLFLFIEAQRE